MSSMHPVIRRSTSPFDLLFNDPFDTYFNLAPRTAERGPVSVMHTDIKEFEDGFVVDVDLPGFKKENISVELKDGYLGISAHTQNETEEKDAEGAFVRKERFQGTCSRRFYVGEDIKNEDITANFENGVLSIKVPKKQEEPEPETGYSIAIS